MTVALTKQAVKPFDVQAAFRALNDARWAVEQAAAGHAGNISWFPIRDAMNDLRPHFFEMAMAYHDHLESTSTE